jgi:hypothetical protein
MCSVTAFLLMFLTIAHYCRYLPGALKRLDAWLLLPYIVLCFCLGHANVSDYMNYKGPFISSLSDTLFSDRLRTCQFIAETSKGKEEVSVGYSLKHGRITRILEENDVGWKISEHFTNRAMAEGKFYDLELLMHHKLKNSNPNVINRDQGELDFLITYNFVANKDLPEAWWHSVSYRDFGMIRVYQKVTDQP